MSRRRGREKSLQDLIGMKKPGGAATAVVEETPPVEPVDDAWPPAEPVDDDAAVAVVPEQREEEPAPAEPGPDAEPVTAEPEPAAEAEVVDAEVVEDTPEPEPQPAPGTAVVMTTDPAAVVEQAGQVIALRDDDAPGSELAIQRKRLLPQLPEMVPPPADATAIEKLEHYENALSGANRNLGLVVDLAKREYVRYVGWTLGPVRDEELWKADPERQFDSFDAYCHEQWGFSADYANKQIRALPVINILRDVTAKELKEGPMRVLVRVLGAAGEQGVLDTWFEAESYGSTSAAALEKAAKALGFIKAGQIEAGESAEGGDGGEDGAADEEPAIQPKLTPKQKAERWLQPLDESVATEDPKDLAATVRELRKLIERYEAMIKERQSQARAAARQKKKDEEEQAPDGE
ncbi:hypothetical protein [Streptomyces albogriseolus]|uniref:hypothetical protein n=1 Tax=Streptomyces albogriseolus TaxID=1887 RepID=UPI003460AB62